MTQQEILEKIEVLKQYLPDNDKRKPNDYFPCAMSIEYTESDIDKTPDDFDWQLFWTKCKEFYPLHSVAGGYNFKSEKTIKKLEHDSVPIYYLEKINKTNKTALEIGFGYGGAAERFKEYGFDYTGIDYVASGNIDKEKKYGNFIEIEESGIPESLFIFSNNYKQFDFVYSRNVFQHMTKKQRLEYYMQIYTILDKDGIFYFDLFTRNEPELEKFYMKEENKNKPYACHFFNVHTSVPSKIDVINTLRKIGFKIVEVKDEPCIDVRTNWTTFIASK